MKRLADIQLKRFDGIVISQCNGSRELWLISLVMFYINLFAYELIVEFLGTQWLVGICTQSCWSYYVFCVRPSQITLSY